MPPPSTETPAGPWRLPEQDAIRLCAEIRWPGGRPDVCPLCGGEDTTALPPYGSYPEPERWRCRGCRRVFSVKTGTALHSSKLGMAAWVKAAQTWWSGPAEIRDALGVSGPTARRVARVLDSTEAPAGGRRLAKLLQPAPATVQDSDPDGLLDSLTCCERDTLRGLRVLNRGATAGRVAELIGRNAGHVRRCLSQLARRGYVKSAVRSVPCGYGQADMRLWELAEPEGQAAAQALPWFHAPPEPAPVAVPTELWWTFWSGISAANVNLSDPDDALMAADRLISSGDLGAMNWALVNLPVDVLRKLRSVRGYRDGPKAKDLDSVIRERTREAA